MTEATEGPFVDLLFMSFLAPWFKAYEGSFKRLKAVV
jgi:hypothetical protein